MLLNVIALLLAFQYFILRVRSNGSNNCSLIYDYLVIGGTTYIGSSLIKRIKHSDPRYSILIINHLVLGDVNYLRYDNGSLSINPINDIIIGDLGDLDFTRRYIKCINTLFHILDFDHMSSYKRNVGIHSNVLQIASGAGIVNYIEINNLFCSNMNYLKEYKTNLGLITRMSTMKIKVFRVFNVFGKGMHLDKLEQKYTIPMLVKQALTSLTGILYYQEALSKSSLSYIYIEDLINTVFHYLQNDVVHSYAQNNTKSYHSMDKIISYLNTATGSASAVNLNESQKLGHMITSLTNYALRYSENTTLVPCITSIMTSHSFCATNQHEENSNISLQMFLPKQPVYSQLMFEKGLVQVFLDVSMRLGRYLTSMTEVFEHWNDEYGIAHMPFIDWIDRFELNNNGRYTEKPYGGYQTTDIELKLLNVLKNISSISNDKHLNSKTCSEKMKYNIRSTTSNFTNTTSTTNIILTDTINTNMNTIMSAKKILIFQQYEEDSQFSLPYYHSYISLLNMIYDICRCSTFESCSIKCGRSDIYLIGQSIMNKVKYKNYLSVADANNTIHNTSCIVVFLNKEYESLKRKLRFIDEINANLAFTHHHNTTEFAITTRIPFIRIPFATNVNDFNIYAHYNTKILPYLYDISTSGHNFRVPWRLWYNNTGIDMLNNIGIHATVSGWVQNVSEYVKNVAISKMWVATLSESDLVPPRVFDVMATNRSLLFLNRPSDSRVLRGILIENQHCILFTTTDEFVEKVIYYSTHESERLQIVHNAYQYALHHHDWTHRSLLILDALDKCPIKRNEIRKSVSKQFF